MFSFFLFFPRFPHLGAVFVCLAKPVFDRVGLRAAISGPCAPSLPSYQRVPHIRYGTCNVLNSLLSRIYVHSDDLFFRVLSGVKSSTVLQRRGRGERERESVGTARQRLKNRQKIHLHYETLSFFTSDLISFNPRPYYNARGLSNLSWPQ